MFKSTQLKNFDDFAVRGTHNRCNRYLCVAIDNYETFHSKLSQVYVHSKQEQQSGNYIPPPAARNAQVHLMRKLSAHPGRIFKQKFKPTL